MNFISLIKNKNQNKIKQKEKMSDIPILEYDNMIFINDSNDSKKDGFQEVKINLDHLLIQKNIELTAYKFQKMLFIYNAINNGWSVKKRGELYYFKKPHLNSSEILDPNYLEKFIEHNLI